MSSIEHRFGGNWTEDKLDRLAQYLPAYTTIFARNKRAQYFSTHYVDAFAGSGSRTSSVDASYSTLMLFDESEIQNLQTFYSGSARIALGTNPPFDHYLFIESNPAFVEELQALRDMYPTRAAQISVVRGDANDRLQNWCMSMDWRRNRAVVFLDPYGMAVTWQTIAALGATRGVDLWVLLPIGQAINRLLTTHGPPTGAWAQKLTTFFGTDEWVEAFYGPRRQPGLFEDDEELEKHATFDDIGAYFGERLRTVFKHVSDSPRMLMNSRNVPIFGLYFATGNETGVKIANYILRR